MQLSRPFIEKTTTLFCQQWQTNNKNHQCPPVGHRKHHNFQRLKQRFALEVLPWGPCAWRKHTVKPLWEPCWDLGLLSQSTDKCIDIQFSWRSVDQSYMAIAASSTPYPIAVDVKNVSTQRSILDSCSKSTLKIENLFLYRNFLNILFKTLQHLAAFEITN